MKNRGDGLHILIANNIYPPIMAGGAELIVQYLAEGLVSKGNKVTVVSTCGPEMEPYPVEIRNGVEVIRFFPKNLYWHWTRGNRPGYQKALWHLRDAWNRDAGKRFGAIIEQRKPDILHTHLIDGMSAILWRRARQNNIPVIHTAHDYHLLCPRSMLLDRSLKICTSPKLSCRMFRRWHIRTTSDVDIFCSPSQFLLDQHKKSGLAARRMEVIPNGIPLPVPVPRIKGETEPYRFLFAARLTEEKGCQVLIDAMKIMPPDLHFELCVAGKGVFEEQFRIAASHDKRIRLLGYIQGEEKTTAFRAADCLLIPSLWYENAPVIIIEAASYGIGVIGSNIGAIPEFIKDGENGLLFEAGNPSSLATAMQRVISEDNLQKVFLGNSRPIVERSSVDNMVGSYMQQYESAFDFSAKIV